MQLKPKKRLGQNFLTDKNIQRKIIAACGLKSSDIVLEIGAGRGELTTLIAPMVKRVYALELDRGLASQLKEVFRACRNVKIITADVLKFDLKKLGDGSIFSKKIEPSPCFKVIGNIPYYITTPVIEKLIGFRDKIEAVFITIQKEVALRILSQPGSKDFGSLSCFLQYYTEPKILFPITKGCFWPQPKVNSCFLKLEIRPKPLIKVKDEALLFRIIRLAFNQRRKILRNSLSGIVSEAKLTYFFNTYKINPNTRPEGLCLEDFANLAKIMSHP
ncbi:MAG TPA: 16S rRNA (adenine(1518)-N(6)/adenine(1519)-N(6))-dimethyltransferase RsmA [Candidatus Omnitrophota bacterium]|nr:16S rRNA (adenine(1518)-N(6)/adenine(1519)-N(6))-dimethyltransferase RsmA [Candidatus Omnitrophota bacterium]